MGTLMRFFVGLLAVAATLAGPTQTISAQGREAVVVRVFTLKNRRAEDALAVVRGSLSDVGSVALELGLNSLTVRDRAQAVEQAGRVLAAWDVPPRRVGIAILLLKAWNASPPEPGPGQPADTSTDLLEDKPTPGPGSPMAFHEIDTRLRRLLNFTNYKELDRLRVEGLEGQRVASVIGTDYRLQFLVDSALDGRTLRLRGLVLDRLRHERGRETGHEILKTSINVPVGQPYVLGVGRDEAAPTALFLVISARWRAAAGGS